MDLRNFQRAGEKNSHRRMLRRMDPLMKRLSLFSFLLLLLLSACGAPAATELPGLPFMVTISPKAQPFAVPLNSPTAFPTEPPALPPLLATATQAPAPTATVSPTYTPYVPTPTETLLPPLELPTERKNAPVLVAWTGLPTYPGDSDPGLLFRMDYDPDVWAQTEGNYGGIVLAHRQIDYCTITPWSGRGLPADFKVEHEFRYIGSAAFDVNTVLSQEVVKFVTYVGGNQHVLTGFQVTFNDQKDKCLQDAEAIFGTLRSFSAVPTITPTFTPAPPTPLISAGEATTPAS
jgi:hypothetical protein